MRNKFPLYVIATCVIVLVGLLIFVIMSPAKNETNTGSNNSSSLTNSTTNSISMSQTQTSISSDLKIEIMQEGTGALTKTGDKVNVHYTGYLTDGTKFDSSVDRGTPFTFTIGKGEVIQGWDQSVVNKKIGTKMKVTIPPELGYGARAVSVIPANSTLIFDIEVLGVK